MSATTTSQLQGRGRPRDDAPRTPRPANTVPPAQYNCMSAPVWTQQHAAPVRDGALDHKHIASRGYRC